MGRKENTNGRTAGKKTGTDRLLGENLSFAATEAYKLLRTNLFFCLPAGAEEKCRVLGVTSSVQGEGKSTTSINLSYMLAQDGKRVCLVEGDMRAPTFGKRLNVRQEQGLAHALAGLNTNQSIVANSELHPNLKVITAGEMPPNPAELLGSERMAACACGTLGPPRNCWMEKPRWTASCAQTRFAAMPGISSIGWM